MPSTHKFNRGDSGNNKRTKKNEDNNTNDDDDDTLMTRKEHGLKFKDADLKIIVGVEQDNEVRMEDDNDDEKERQAIVEKNKSTKASEKKKQMKVYWYIKEILASKSKYIETLLSMPFVSACFGIKNNNHGRITSATTQDGNNNDYISGLNADGMGRYDEIYI